MVMNLIESKELAKKKKVKILVTGSVMNVNSLALKLQWLRENTNAGK